MTSRILLPLLLALAARLGAMAATPTTAAPDAAPQAGVVTPRLWVGDRLPPGLAATGRVEVAYTGAATGRVVSARFESGRGQVLSTRALEPGRRYQVDFLLPAPAGVLPGQVRDMLLIQSDPPGEAPLQAGAFASFRGQVRAVPPFLSFTVPPMGSANTNAPPLSRFVLLNEDAGGPFEITSVDGPVPGARATFKQVRKGMWRVDLANLNTSALRNGQALRIHTTLTTAPVVELPVVVNQDRPAATCSVCRSLEHRVHPGGASGAATNAPPAKAATQP